MSRNLKSRLALIAGLTVLALLLLVPTMRGQGVPLFASYQLDKLSLGLDLAGGMHLKYLVRTDKYIESRLAEIKSEVRLIYEHEKKTPPEFELDRKNLMLKLIYPDAESLRADDELLRDRFSGFDRDRDGNAIVLTPNSDFRRLLEREAVDQAEDTIRKRTNELGVKGSSIHYQRTQGVDTLVIQLPGVHDVGEAKKWLGKPAVLQFKLVPDNRHVAKDVETLKERFPDYERQGMEIYPHRGKPPEGEDQGPIIAYYMLQIAPDINGADLANANASLDQYGLPAVSFRFNDAAARKFANITGANIGKQLAIVLDDEIVSSPNIQSRIHGSGIISGSFSDQDVQQLAGVLRSGHLVVPLEVQEERTISASLGADSVHKGTLAMVIGMALVMIFMVIYYKGAGLLADLALVLNILFILAGLSLFGATLTFPGIAGMILTVGMAVDGNIIVFERIREELRIGKSARSSVQSGYDKATWTILDANITTVVAALMLFQFGTGPIKGFAVTLIIGVLSSMFTAIVVTRSVYDILIEKTRFERISI
ncbi:MAG: protein translocase subunit SecD [Candidatus Alcyoniella australis]|nr:protein translocase subunit SecD [Candidatus Alcyoniella australis]